MNWALLANSLLLAGLSTALATIVGVAVAVVMLGSVKSGRTALLISSVAVLALPSFLVTNCWIDLLGANGLLHRWLPLDIFSLGGAAWILTLLLWPIPAVATWSAWQKLEPVHFEIDPALRDHQLWRKLLFPAAKSHLAVSAAVVFALALSNFSVPTILQVKVFTSEMWIQFNTNLDAAAALRLSWPLLLAPMALLVFALRKRVSWPRATQAEVAVPARQQLGHWFLAAAIVSGLALLVSLAVPLAQLTATPRTWSEFVPAAIAGREATVNSLVYAAAAAALALVIGFVCARVPGLSILWLLFFVPGVLLGIGALRVFNQPALDWFTRTAVIVIALLALRHLALTRSMSRAALDSADSDLLDAAKLDGARGVTLLRCVVLPQIAPQLGIAAYLVYLLCLWDVETILLVIPPGGETLAVRVFNLLHYGHNAHVNALCLLLLTLAVAPLAMFATWKLVRRA